ncbi:MAG: L-serine ammonia-lyase, iron-sulfur-dependent, subunit alpha, partial [Firmicutes bacterium]|nr:L-serine ammonia-lyase, iron-sulfur-dependent, subunit alpha [Bacillota bacterium]
MKSLTDLYRIGYGPSSSHTMGPAKAARIAKEKCPDADGFRVILYSSLAKTGKGHMTDAVLRKVLSPVPSEIVFDMDTPTPEHPNTMEIIAYKAGQELQRFRIRSVGGGAIQMDGYQEAEAPEVYVEKNFDEIYQVCKQNGWRLWEYVEHNEGEEIWKFLAEVWKTMKTAVEKGLKREGVLPGGLEVQRRAPALYNQYNPSESPETRENRMVCAYAFAVSEQNASGNRVVTAPTCGSCGVVPAVLYYYQNKLGLPDQIILRALATGGVIGNVVKTNASISGAECGCQAEVGTACCMASAALAEINGLSLEQIEYSAEVSMEHMLGLTCDPIDGLVQIPCIERNAVAAMRSINAVSIATFLTSSRKITFDTVV